MADKKVMRGKARMNPKRVRGASKPAETGIKRVVPILEKQAEKRFERLFVRVIWRFGLVSQKDVRDLLQRIEHLERRLGIGRPSPRLKPAARKLPAPSSAEEQVTVIG